MAYEQRPGSGTIFRNEHKTTDKHPEYRGSVLTPEGEKYDISLWVKKSQTGRSYFSVSLQEPYVKSESDRGEVNNDDGVIDDLPF